MPNRQMLPNTPVIRTNRMAKPWTPELSGTVASALTKCSEQLTEMREHMLTEIAQMEDRDTETVDDASARPTSSPLQVTLWGLVAGSQAEGMLCSPSQRHLDSINWLLNRAEVSGDLVRLTRPLVAQFELRHKDSIEDHPLLEKLNTLSDCCWPKPARSESLEAGDKTEGFELDRDPWGEGRNRFGLSTLSPETHQAALMLLTAKILRGLLTDLERVSYSCENDLVPANCSGFKQQAGMVEWAQRLEGLTRTANACLSVSSKIITEIRATFLDPSRIQLHLRNLEYLRYRLEWCEDGGSTSMASD